MFRETQLRDYTVFVHMFAAVLRWELFEKKAHQISIADKWPQNAAIAESYTDHNNII